MDHQSRWEAGSHRRSAIWEGVQRIQQERSLVADGVREIGCYNVARGIWRDKISTSNFTLLGSGVFVGISSRGKYEDEIFEETGTYDYPATKSSTYDQGDIDSMRVTLELGLPVFLIRDTNAKGELLQEKGSKRRVDRIEFLEDDPISGNLFSPSRLTVEVTTNCLRMKISRGFLVLRAPVLLALL